VRPIFCPLCGGGQESPPHGQLHTRLICLPHYTPAIDSRGPYAQRLRVYISGTGPGPPGPPRPRCAPSDRRAPVARMLLRPAPAAGWRLRPGRRRRRIAMARQRCRSGARSRRRHAFQAADVADGGRTHRDSGGRLEICCAAGYIGMFHKGPQLRCLTRAAEPPADQFGTLVLPAHSRARIAALRRMRPASTRVPGSLGWGLEQKRFGQAGTRSTRQAR